MNKKLEELLIKSIPIAEARFHQAVNNSDKVPETYYSIDSANSSRRIEMHLTPNFLLCNHKDKYYAVPLANIIDMRFKEA